MPELHSSIVSLVSLASGIASNHPAMGQCQIAKLRHMGIDEEQIKSVVEIARHIRDEAAEKIDVEFDLLSDSNKAVVSQTQDNDSGCCSSTSSGRSCC